MSFNLFNKNKNDNIEFNTDYSNEPATDFIGFFPLFKRRFWDLSALNMIFIATNIPFLFALLAFFGVVSKSVSSPTNSLYSQLYGIMQHTNNPLTAALNGLLGNNTEIFFPTKITYIFYAISLLTIITFGLSNVGMSYVLRGYVRNEPMSVLSDYFYSIKKNYKQGIVMGIVDIIFFVAITWDIIFWSMQSGFINNMMFYASLFLALLYFYMRFYVYIMLITFDLSIFKLIKNGLIFSILGFKRNFIGGLAIIFIAFLNYYIFLLFPPIGIAVMILLSFSFTSFISAYCAYPNIKRIMIDPYYTKKEEPAVEPIFHDRG